MRTLRVYVDTSVFGGMYDDEFEKETKRFFDMVAEGRFRLAVSDQVQDEVILAPPEVRNFFFTGLPKMEYLDFVAEVRKLADLYIANKVVTEKYLADAIHVAYATIYKCEGVISWNFDHLANQNRSVRFNMVNTEHGYSQLFIATPMEVESHEPK